jgi:YD repeat-containing protein
MVGYDSSGTNFNPEDRGISPTNAGQLSQTWSYNANWLISDTPAESNGIVYFGSWDDSIYALNAQTGALVWSYATGSSVSSSPAVVNGVVYIGSQDDKLYALNAQTGSLLWTYTTGNQITNSPVVSNGMVYVTSLDGRLYALNTTNGNLQWSYAIGGTTYSPSTPTVANGTVYVGSSQNNTLFALNAQTGSLKWSYITGGSVFAAPAVSGTTVYVSDWDNNVYALDTATGTLRWKFSTGASIGASPAVANGTVYVGSWDNKLYAINSQTGTQEWAFTTGNKIFTAAAVANGVVYVSSGDDTLYAIDASTGEFLWSHVGSGPAGSPIVADSRVYVSNGSNTLLAFQAPPAPKQVSLSAAGSASWWNYKSGTLPGVGTYQVNTASDNLMTQATDMSIPNKGVDLTFTRTYNSQSRHDYANTDGSGQDNYGNGWTNTYDAHLAFNTGNKYGRGITVYDSTGTPYEYMPDGSGHWIAPAGVYTQLTHISNCTYAWTDKTGESYIFYTPEVTEASCAPYMGSMPAYNGKLAALYGRNQNTYLQLAYYWDGNGPKTSSNLQRITITTEAGQSAQLNFADFSGRRLLASLVYPDGTTTITYGYDVHGDLVEADLPANSSPPPSNRRYPLGIPRIGPEGVQCVDWTSSQSCRETAYTYTSGASGYELAGVSGPRWMDSDGSDGGFVTFAYNDSGQLTTINHVGLMNPTGDETDGLDNNPFQFGISTSPNFTYLTETFATAYTGDKASNGGTTTWQDTDGHKTTYTFDGRGRLTQETDFTGSGQNSLSTEQEWDASNNVIASTDARGNTTHFAYDANGNQIASAQPLVTTSAGIFRPTTYTVYDAHNNVIATCDAVWSNLNGQNWTTPPTQANQSCASAVSGASNGAVEHMQYSYPTYEPSGELTSTTSPLGYVTTTSYDPAAQGGLDYGLPTSTTGASYTQIIPTASGAPSPGATDTQTVYDQYGNVICSNVTGDGRNRWTLNEYTSLNQLKLTANPDDTSVTIAGCDKTPDTTGAFSGPTRIVTQYTYYPDGSIATETSPTQSSSQPTSYTYDADGDQASVITYNGCTSSTSCTPDTTYDWYDGADRLIEVEEPSDPSDKFANSPWVTRYLYDLTQNGQDVIASEQNQQTLSAHGNMYTVQGYFPASTASFIDNDTGWRDESGTAYDALDRTTTQYSLPPSAGSTAAWQPETYTYDQQNLSPCPTDTQVSTCSNDNGLLSSETSPLGVTTHYGYDSTGNLAWTSYSNEGVTPCSGNGGTPCTANLYDADGRLTSAWTSQFSSPETYTYNAAGQVTQSIEPASTQATATTTYSYYPDGTTESMSVSSSGFSPGSAPVYEYDHSADGTPQAETVTAFGQSYPFTFTYTNGGRYYKRLEPGNATNAWFEYMNYESNGEPTSMNIPGVSGGSASYQLQQDANGQTSQVHAWDGGQTQWTVNQSYNSRNELTGTSDTTNYVSGYGSSTTITGTNYHGAFGLMQADPTANTDQLDLINGTLMTFDTNNSSSNPTEWNRTANANGQFTQITSYQQSWPLGSSPNLGQSGATFTDTNMQYEFNANNQLTNSAFGWMQGTYNCPGGSGGGGGADAVATNPLETIDGAGAITPDDSGGSGSGGNCDGNWTVNPTSPPPGPDADYIYSYKWGADGNLSSISGGTLNGPETLHWANGQLLFTTNGSGKVDDLKIGSMADITLDGNGAPHLAVYDRLPDGTFSAVRTTEHPQASAVAMNVNPFSVPCGDPTAPCKISIPTTGEISFNTGDNQGVVFQGDRALDYASQSWLTPSTADANPSNPVSLKPYSYEYNNSESYESTTTNMSWGNFWWSAMITAAQDAVEYAVFSALAPAAISSAPLSEGDEYAAYNATVLAPPPGGLLQGAMTGIASGSATLPTSSTVAYDPEVINEFSSGAEMTTNEAIAKAVSHPANIWGAAKDVTTAFQQQWGSLASSQIGSFLVKKGLSMAAGSVIGAGAGPWGEAAAEIFCAIGDCSLPPVAPGTASPGAMFGSGGYPCEFFGKGSC